MNDSLALKKNMAKQFVGSCNIKVAVRLRPIIARENSEIIRWKSEEETVFRVDQDKSVNPMKFDKVFDEFSTNHQIFESMVEPLIKKAVDGFNAAVIAYGQTSSGKTYTMMGDSKEQGIIPLCFDYLFKAIDNLTVQRSFLIGVSFLEVYNEKIRDLLNKENKSLSDKEKPEDIKLVTETDGSVRADCTIEMVSDPKEIMALMDLGNSIKAMGETKMNERSSRSHTIFRIHIESQEDKDGSVRVSQINLVDLAGSERASATGATGQRFKEGCNINLSLLQLGNVVQKLSEDKGGHIDYRSSKLTRLLQSSLAGNANISMICNITPVAAEQSQSTLQFALRASTIKLSPHLTEVMDDATTIKRHAKRIKELEQKLQNAEYLEEKNLELQEEMNKLRALFIMSSFSSHQQVLDEQVRSNRRQTWAGGTFLKMKPLVPLTTLYEESFGVSQHGFASDRPLPFERTLDVSSLSNEEQPSAMNFASFASRSSTASDTSSRPSMDPLESTPILPNKQLSRLPHFDAVSETPPATLRMRILQLESRISQLSQVANTSPEVLEQRLGESPRTSILEIKKRLEDNVKGTPPAKLKEQKQILEGELKELEDEYKSLREYTTLERQLLTDEENEKLLIQIESLKCRLKNTESMYLETNDKYEGVVAENQELDKQMEQLAKELDVNKKWIARNNEQQRKELEEYKEKYTLISNQARDWQDEKELLKSRYENKITELQDCLNEAWAQQNNQTDKKSDDFKDNLETQLENLKAELAAKEKMIQLANSNIEQLKIEISQKTDEVLTEKLDDCLKEKITVMDQVIENLNSELKIKERALMIAVYDLEQMKTEKQESNQFEDKSDTLREEIFFKDQEIENLKLELTNKEEALLEATSNLQLENSELNDTKSKTEKLCEDLNKKVLTLQDEIDNLKLDVTNKEDRLTCVTSEIETLKLENNEVVLQLKEENCKFEEQCDSLREKMFFMDQDIANLTNQLEIKHESLQYANSEIEKLKSELSQSNKNHGAILQQKEECHVLKLEELKLQIKELCKEKSVADASIQENMYDPEILAAQEVNAVLDQKLKLLSQEKENIQKQLDDLSVSHEELKNENQHYHESMDIMQSKIEELEMASKSEKVFEFQHDSLRVAGDMELIKQENVKLELQLDTLQTSFNESFDHKMSEQELEKQSQLWAEKNSLLTKQLNETLEGIRDSGLLPELIKQLPTISPEIEQYVANQMEDLMETKNILELELNTLKEELDHLKIENTGLTDKQTDLEVQISNLEEQLRGNKDTPAPNEVVTCKEKLIREILGLDTSYSKQSLMDKNLQEIFDIFICIVIEKQQECNSKMQSELVDLKKKNSELKTDLQDRKEEINHFTRSKETIQQELVSTREQLSVCIAESSEISLEKSQLQVQVKELLSSLNKSERDHSEIVSNLQSTLQESQLKMEDLEKQLTETSQNYARLVETKESEFNERLAQLEINMKSETGEVCVTSSDSSQLLDEIQELKSKIEFLESKNTENVVMQQTIESLKSDLENSKHLNAEKQKEYENKIVELEILVSQSEISISDLKQNAELQVSSLEQLCSEKEDIETRRSVLETQLGSLRQEFEIKSQQYENLMSEYESYQSTHAELVKESEAVSKYKLEISELKSQLCTLSNQYQELEAECSLLKQEKINCEENFKLQMSQLEVTITDTRLQLDTLKSEYSNCQQLLDQLKQERGDETTKYANDIALTSTQITELTEQVKRLESEYSRVTSENCANQTEIANLLKTIDDAHTSFQTYKQQISEQELELEKYQTLKIEHSTCKQTEELLKSEKLETSSQLEQLQTEFSTLKSEKHEIEESNRTLKVQFEIQEKQTLSTQAQLDELTTQHSSCGQHLETTKAKFESDIADNRSQYHDLLKKYKDIQLEFDSLKKDKLNCDNSIQQLEKTLSEANNFNSLFKIDSQSQKVKISELETKIKQLVLENDELHQFIKNLKSQLKSAVSENQNSEEQNQLISSLQDNITKANTKLNVLQGEKEALLLQLDEAKIDISEKDAKLIDAEDEFQAMLKDYKIHYAKRNEFEREACHLEIKNKKLETIVAELETKIAQLPIKSDENHDLAECQQELQAKTCRITEQDRKLSEYRTTGAQLQSQVDELTKEKQKLRRELADKRGELAIAERKLIVEDFPFRKESEQLQSQVHYLEQRIQGMSSEIRHLRSIQPDVTFQHECGKCRKKLGQNASQETQTSVEKKSVSVQAPPDNEALWDRRDGYLPSSAITEAARMYGMKRQLQDLEAKISELQKDRNMFKAEIHKRNQIIVNLKATLKTHNKENQGDPARSGFRTPPPPQPTNEIPDVRRSARQRRVPERLSPS